jgi:glycosyltransferase involved in cell wall biosynthesis
MTRQKIDLGIFAHNEASGIEDMLVGLVAQDALAHPDFDLRIVVLANGCRDDTVGIARKVLAPGLEVIDLAEGGKSRTWNRFVHEISRVDAHTLIFCDADIEIPAQNGLRLLIDALAARPELWVLNSQPVKDIVYHPVALSFIDKVIASAGGGLDDWKTSICGQLYAMPAARARALHLPIGLPVEDGFLRAMVLTDALTTQEYMSRIDGLGGLVHVYASERGIGALIRHQERIVIGSAINAACFAALRQIPAQMRHAELARASVQPDWLNKILAQQLPRWRFGYIPMHFWVKRLVRFAQTPGGFRSPRRLIITALGFVFDTIVYAKAQFRMFQGVGAGFW